jgi:hypothetical protein
MEKLLLVINVHQPNIASIDFACQVASLTGTKLTGLFIENIYSGYVPEDINGPSYFERIKAREAETAVTTDTGHAVKLFVEECTKKSVSQETYIDRGEPIQEIIYESRFADLLIIDPDIDFYQKTDQLPSHLVKEILANAECPVILAPDKYNNMEEIVFCYNGSASSVFAIKQFTYLLPQLSNKKVVLLEVNESGSEEFNESHRRVLSWLRAHYVSVIYYNLEGNSKDRLFTYLLKKTKCWVVMGAYGRSLLSRFFKKSSADLLIRTVDLPLFITHF